MLDASIKKTLKYLREKHYGSLAFLLEETWDRRPRNGNEYHIKMWEEQLALNIPVLYLSCICIHEFARKHNINNILFARRDCCHLHRIYHALYLNENIHYFHCSRNMFEAAIDYSRPAFDRYVDKITDNDPIHTLYVDVHGTGRRMFDYFTKRGNGIPACFIISSAHDDVDGFSDDMKKMVKKGRAEFLVFNAGGSPIEMINYDLIGTCNDFTSNGPVRAPVEYDKKYVIPYHDCNEAFLKVIHENSSLDESDHNIDNIIDRIKHIYKPALEDLPVISHWIKPERKH